MCVCVRERALETEVIACSYKQVESISDLVSVPTENKRMMLNLDAKIRKICRFSSATISGNMKILLYFYYTYSISHKKLKKTREQGAEK